MSMPSDYWWYKEHGICVFCRQDNAIRGQVLCANCRDKNAFQKHEYYNEHKSEIREKKKILEKDKRKKRKDKGLCVDCGMPAFEGRTRCQRCVIRSRLYTQKYRLKKLWS